MTSQFKSISPQTLLKAFLGTSLWAEQKAQSTGEQKFDNLKACSDRLFFSFSSASNDDIPIERQVVRSPRLQADIDTLIKVFNEVLAADPSDLDRKNQGLRTSIRRIAKFRDDISDAGSGCGKVVDVEAFERPYSDL